ncbi:MAG: Ig-like domain-containing protein [bacterium]|nr:Ig-like domain-containing protein [bacterium]
MTASFDPAGALSSPSTAYSVPHDYDWSARLGRECDEAITMWRAFSTGSTPDLTSPIVISTIPIDGAVSALIGGNLAATFSESMNPLTITASTFTLRQGATAISGTVSYTGVT